MRIILDKEAFEEAWNEFFSIHRLDIHGYIEYSEELLQEEDRPLVESNLCGWILNSDFIYKVDVFDYMYMDFTDDFNLKWHNTNRYQDYKEFKFNGQLSLQRSLENFLIQERKYFLENEIYPTSDEDSMFDEIIDKVIDWYELDETVVKKIDE